MSTSLPFNLAGLPVGNATIPKEGPKAIPIALDFNNQPSYLVDISSLYAQGVLSIIQVIFVDAIDATSDITVYISGTAQRLKVVQGSQGYYPVLSPVNGTITFSGAGVAQAFLINVPMSVLTWLGGGDGAGANFAFDNAGNLKTADQNLAGLVTDNGLKVVETGGGGGGKPSFVCADAVFNAANYFQTLGPGGAAGQCLFITSLEIWISGDMYKAGGGLSNFKLMWQAADIVYRQISFACQDAAPAEPPPGYSLIRWEGGPVYDKANSSQRLDCGWTDGSAPTAGNLYLHLEGYYDTVPTD